MSDQLFELVPNSRGGRVRCTACGAMGYDTGDYERSWQNSHRRGHSECPDCGRVLTLKRDGEPQVHKRCPGRPG